MGQRRPGRSTLLKKQVDAIVGVLIDDGMFSLEDKQALLNIIVSSNQAAIDYVKSAGERRTQALSEMEFATTEQSEEVYNSLPPELKKRALKNTRGYLYTDQFLLARTDVVNIERLASSSPGNLFPSGQSEAFIGDINIGATALQAMLENVSSLINESIFEIVTSLKLLTTNLNSYFAGGLQDDKKADVAIDAADNIEGKTEELKQDQK